jgi:hypothetical protein
MAIKPPLQRPRTESLVRAYTRPNLNLGSWQGRVAQAILATITDRLQISRSHLERRKSRHSGSSARRQELPSAGHHSCADQAGIAQRTCSLVFGSAATHLVSSLHSHRCSALLSSVGATAGASLGKEEGRVKGGGRSSDEPLDKAGKFSHWMKETARYCASKWPVPSHSGPRLQGSGTRPSC